MSYLFESASITIKRGATLDVGLSYEGDLDMTGWDAHSQVRRSEKDNQVVLELEPELVGKVLYLRKSHTETAKLPPGDYVYDIVFTSPEGEKYPTPTDKFTVENNVTR